MPILICCRIKRIKGPDATPFIRFIHTFEQDVGAEPSRPLEAVLHMRRLHGPHGLEDFVLVQRDRSRSVETGQDQLCGASGNGYGVGL